MMYGAVGANTNSPHKKSKAAAHVAVDLQCWHCKALIE